MLLTLPQSYDEMIAAMLRCEQTKGQNVYQHGLSVSQHIDHLLQYLREGTEIDWRIPKWIDTYRSQILANLHDERKIHQYALLHDCGKAYCRTVDESGVHFPDHANVSKEVYLSVGKDPIVANLIGWDMVIHTATSEEITVYCQEWTVQDAITLLVAALAEVHSNARLFGGIDSNSFKVKWKKIDRRGNQICKHYFG